MRAVIDRCINIGYNDDGKMLNECKLQSSKQRNNHYYNKHEFRSPEIYIFTYNKVLFYFFSGLAGNSCIAGAFALSF